MPQNWRSKYSVFTESTTEPRCLILYLNQTQTRPRAFPDGFLTDHPSHRARGLSQQQPMSRRASARAPWHCPQTAATGAASCPSPWIGTRSDVNLMQFFNGCDPASVSVRVASSIRVNTSVSLQLYVSRTAALFRGFRF